MHFDNPQHQFYCGIDRHARTSHVCTRDHQGNGVYDKSSAENRPLTSEAPKRFGVLSLQGPHHLNYLGSGSVSQRSVPNTSTRRHTMPGRQPSG